MIGRTNAGGGSGGGGIELKILPRLTRPERPSVNTVWVETAEQVTDYTFSAVEPRSPKNGLLWIVLTNEGTSEVISPVDKEWMVMRVSGVKLRVNGEWVAVSSRMYKDGVWKLFTQAWDGYYFKSGDQCIDTTGGWTTEGWTSTTHNLLNNAAINNDHLYVIAWGAFVCQLGTVNKVDLTNISTLKASVTIETEGEVVLCVSSTKSHNGSVAYMKNTATGTHTYSVDVSGLSGSYYIIVYATGASSRAPVAKITNVWGE